MTATRIRQLSWFMPRQQYPISADTVPMDIHTADLAHYLDGYRDLRFGWHFASLFAYTGTPLPSLIEGDDIWLWRAYLTILGEQDDAVMWAYALTLASMSQMRGQIESLLITPDLTTAAIAKEVKIPLEVVEAYEKLFYNVVDRRNDVLFISRVVYPDTRLVEMLDGYVANTELNTLLLRAGYNNGAQDALYLAGAKFSPAGGLKGRDAAERLESAIMANGFVLARNGFLNQSANAVGLMHSRQIIQAAKQAGEDTSQQSVFSSLGTSLMGEIRMSARNDAQIRLANAIDVTAVPVRPS